MGKKHVKVTRPLGSKTKSAHMYSPWTRVVVRTKSVVVRANHKKIFRFRFQKFSFARFFSLLLSRWKEGKEGEKTNDLLFALKVLDDESFAVVVVITPREWCRLPARERRPTTSKKSERVVVGGGGSGSGLFAVSRRSSLR